MIIISKLAHYLLIIIISYTSTVYSEKKYF